MTDSELIGKRNVEQIKHSKVIQFLKKFVGATIIIKHIIDLEVNLTVGKLLTLVLTLK